MTFHKQVSRTCPLTRRRIRVDEGIAPLLVECWKAGIPTTMSCQDNQYKGGVWIAFPSHEARERFCALVGESDGWRVQGGAAGWISSLVFPCDDMGRAISQLSEFNRR